MTNKSNSETKMMVDLIRAVDVFPVAEITLIGLARALVSTGPVLDNGFIWSAEAGPHNTWELKKEMAGLDDNFAYPDGFMVCDRRPPCPPDEELSSTMKLPVARMTPVP